MLKDLIGKQTLISDYLTNNYEFIENHKDETLKIIDKFTRKSIYGEEIEEDILDFYPFGEDIMNVVINVWISSNGFKRKSKKIKNAWYKNGVKNRTRNRIAISYNVDHYDMRYLDYHRYGRDSSSNGEVEIVRRICEVINNEFRNNDMPFEYHYLLQFRQFRELEEFMEYINFENHRIQGPNGVTFNWIEGDISFDSRIRHINRENPFIHPNMRGLNGIRF